MAKRTALLHYLSGLLFRRCESCESKYPIAHLKGGTKPSVSPTQIIIPPPQKEWSSARCQDGREMAPRHAVDRGLGRKHRGEAGVSSGGSVKIGGSPWMSLDGCSCQPSALRGSHLLQNTHGVASQMGITATCTSLRATTGPRK